MSSEESTSLSPASRVLALADKVADEHELLAKGVDSEGQQRRKSRDLIDRPKGFISKLFVRGRQGFIGPGARSEGGLTEFESFGDYLSYMKATFSECILYSWICGHRNRRRVLPTAVEGHDTGGVKRKG